MGLRAVVVGKQGEERKVIEGETKGEENQKVYGGFKLQHKGGSQVEVFTGIVDGGILERGVLLEQGTV